MNISIIVPTFNEEQTIKALVGFLQKYANGKVSEIIVCDGESSDNTVLLAKHAGAKVLQSPVRGRSSQMNFGASNASGDIFYFVHADAFPPKTFVNDIFNAVKNGYSLGRYKTKFISNKPILRINEWFTQFDFFICMGGDQTLFVRKTLFERLNGFNEEMALMEEYEFCTRARKQASYKIMPGAALISARKYEKNSWLQVQKANYKVVQLYKKGATQQTLVETYKRMLNW